MSFEWPQVSLRDFADLLAGFAFKSTGYTDAPEDVRLLRGDNIAPGNVRWDGVKRWPKSEASELLKYSLKAGDVVLAMDRPWIPAGLKVAKVGVSDAPSYLVQRVARLRAASLEDQNFLFSLLSAPDFETYIKNATTGTAVPHISAKQILDYTFNLPPMHVRAQVGALAAALNDRITLLRETNATLEAIAQALFKSWFVDFDPVRAKAAGRQPEGMDAATAALFPDSFEETELGVVPRGWQVFSLGEVAVVKGGKQLEKECFSESGKNPVFGGAGVMGRSDFQNASGFVITVGRVGAYCGQFFWHIGGAWVNNNASQILPNSEFSPMWLYEFLRATDIESIKKGAAQPFVSNGDLANLKMALPAANIVRCFSDFADPIY